MTKEKLMTILEAMPVGSLVYVRHGSAQDDAYPAAARFFKEGGGGPRVLYLQVDYEQTGNHRNFPEHYSGVTELPLPGSGKPKARHRLSPDGKVCEACEGRRLKNLERANRRSARSTS